MRYSFVYNLTSVCKKCYADEKIRIADDVAGYRLSEQAKETCALLVYLSMKTEYFGEPTKIMLKTGKSYRRVAREMEDKNVNTVRSKICYDINKLKKKLGEDAMDKIIKSNADLSGYIQTLKELIKKQKKFKLLEGFAIKLPPCPPDLVVEQLSEGEKQVLRFAAMNYAKKAVKEEEQRIKPKHVAYMKYIEKNAGKLSPDEEAFYRALKAYLVGEDKKK